METKICTIDKENIDIEICKRAGQIIKDGGLVAFPTETVYGLGGDALNSESSTKIYAAKGRPSDNPLIVHIADIDSLYTIANNVSENALKLAKEFWPGPLTMIFEKKDIVPLETTGGMQTVAVRMPSDPIAMEFIKQAGGFVAAPSANLSGRPSPTMAKHVAEDMTGRIEMILDGGDVGIGLESTIIDLTSEKPMILRPGYITQKMLEDVLGVVEIDKTILDNTSKTPPKAPGMKYRHYAPKGELIIVEGTNDKVIDYINQALTEHKAKGEKTGVIGTEETVSKYCADVVENAGRREDEEVIAHRLFALLRDFDEKDVKHMYSESFTSDGVGQAIMNRLLKAAGHKVIRLE